MFISKIISVLVVAATLCCFAGKASAASTPKKHTQIESLAANPLPVSRGQNLTLSGQFFYQDKKGKWQAMNYTSVPIQIWVGSTLMKVVPTGKNGCFSYTFNVPKTWKTGTYSWKAKFAGDIELFDCYKTGKLTVQ